MIVDNNKWFNEIKDTVLLILNKPNMYGNSSTLEGKVLGITALLGISKGWEIIEVLELWKDYCYSIFGSKKYILSEMPPDFVIPDVDNKNQDLLLAKKETFAWLSMNYVDYRRHLAVLQQSKSNEYSMILPSDVIVCLENEFLRMLGFEYYDYFRGIPNFYGYFCTAFLGAYCFNCGILGKPLFEDYYKTFTKAHHSLQEFYVGCYGVDDPRNVQYVNHLFSYYEKNGTLDKYTPPFYWTASYIDQESQLRIQNQILSGLIFMINKIDSEMKIEFKL